MKRATIIIAGLFGATIAPQAAADIVAGPKACSCSSAQALQLALLAAA